MKTLAYYDMTGIQNFIFLSKKMRENIGASSIVSKLFSNENLKSLGVTEIDLDKGFESDSKEGKIIFSGGGNLLLMFNDKESAINFTKKLSKNFYDYTYGLVSFAVSYKETNLQDYQKDFDELIKQANIRKNKLPKKTSLLGISITRESFLDNLPAYYKDEDGYISKPAYLMRREEEINIFEEKFKEVLDGLTFEKNIEKFRGKEDGHLAYIHIDGNSMGNFIKGILQNSKDFKDSIRLIKKISFDINKIYEKAFSETLKKMKNKKHFIANNKIKIRPIIFGGDDITLICEGKYGLSIAEDILKNIEQERIKIDGKELTLTASAGVALVKAHFPFYRGYELAEELCKSAKEKGKRISSYYKLNYIGSWIDFHIVFSGITTDLKTLRNKIYSVPNMQKPEPKEGYDSYNLLWRPYYIGGEKILEKFNFNNLKKLVNDFNNKPKNKIKKLRSYLIKSKEDVEFYINFLNSRNFCLPTYDNSNKIFTEEKITPYYDAIEIMEFLENI
ncbi:MAG: hypothetical protein ABIN11_04785 [candidate division WOR-3 bacterium]